MMDNNQNEVSQSIMKLHYETVTSTNDVVKKLLADNDCPLVIVSADKQTNGKGRIGRKWISDGDNIYMSIGVKRKKNGLEWISISPQTILMAVSLILKSTIVESIPVEIKRLWRVLIKYPNDIHVEQLETRMRYKISGMLLETTYMGSDWFSLVIGIGINTNSCPELETDQQRYTAYSLREITKSDVNNKKMVDKIVDNFLWITKQEELSIIEQWKNEVNLVNRKILMRNTGEEYLVTDILDTGILIVHSCTTNQVRQITDQDSFDVEGLQ
jgi:BirA family transcriptional regulator, biotin operon repressor / biotin---[acetyl-CoA-carboxylase] ligase